MTPMASRPFFVLINVISTPLQWANTQLHRHVCCFKLPLQSNLAFQHNTALDMDLKSHVIARVWCNENLFLENDLDCIQTLNDTNVFLVLN